MRYRAFRGDDGMWGVEDDSGAVLYDADLARQTAEATADMESSESPPADWDETKAKLVTAGLPC